MRSDDVARADDESETADAADHANRYETPDDGLRNERGRRIKTAMREDSKHGIEFVKAPDEGDQCCEDDGEPERCGHNDECYMRHIGFSLSAARAARFTVYA